MATFKSSTFGAISGKHGTVVAATTKEGTTYLRMFRPPSDPKTDKQKNQRTKFGFANKTLRCFRPLFKDIYGNRKGATIGISNALKSEVITGEYPDYSIDYAMLVFSEGAVNTLLSPVATITEDTKISLTWEFIEALDSKEGDAVNFIFFHEDTQLTLHHKAVATRGLKKYECTLPEAWIGSDVHCWTYVSNSNGLTTAYSNSTYITALKL